MQKIESHENVHTCESAHTITSIRFETCLLVSVVVFMTTQSEHGGMCTDNNALLLNYDDCNLII